jgi:hypothetical protein
LERGGACKPATGGATGLGPGPEGWGPAAGIAGLCGLMKTCGLVWGRVRCKGGDR